MKNKFFILGIVLFLAIGLVSAAQGAPNTMSDEDMEGQKSVLADDTQMEPRGGNAAVPTLYQNGNGEGERVMLREGQLTLGEGKQVRVQQGEQGLRLESNGKAAECKNCQLEQVMVQGQTQIQAKLSNGKNAEIKVMPDQASQRALERLRLKNCPEETCTIELKEVGSGDEAKIAYEVKTQKRAKFLGIFGSNMNVEAQVDAETGEVLKSKKPWWAFMASEKDETLESEAQ